MPPVQDPRVAKVLAHITRDLTRRVTLVEAARVACLEPLYFSKRFHKTLGTPFALWSAHVRVEAAKKLLATPALSISAVAAAVGYQDITTFERAFRKCESISPSQYRRRLVSQSVEEDSKRRSEDKKR
jgi:two-component system response regulator YesN